MDDRNERRAKRAPRTIACTPTRSLSPYLQSVPRRLFFYFFFSFPPLPPPLPARALISTFNQTFLAHITPFSLSLSRLFFPFPPRTLHLFPCTCASSLSIWRLHARFGCFFFFARNLFFFFGRGGGTARLLCPLPPFFFY